MTASAANKHVGVQELSNTLSDPTVDPRFFALSEDKGIAADSKFVIVQHSGIVADFFEDVPDDVLVPPADAMVIDDLLDVCH